MSDKFWESLLATLVPTLTVILTYVRTRRKVEQVHTLVNSSHTAALVKIDQLQNKLETAKNRTNPVT